MFDTKTMTLIKSIDVGAARPDGIYFDPFNERVYVFSHPTKDATVIDAKDGTVLGTIDLGGVPGAGRRRRQGHALRRHAGRGRQRHRRRREDDEGGRALLVRGQRRLQRPRARREESGALRGMQPVRQSAAQPRSRRW